LECCAECGAFAVSEAELDGEQSAEISLPDTTVDENSLKETSRSTLIEFPGIPKSTVPEWRRELSERVREVQERRAREAAQEAAEAERRRLAAETAAAVPQLELLPQASAPPLNPLVAAALRRIERANRQTAPSSPSVVHASHAPMAAVAYADNDSESAAGKLSRAHQTPGSDLKRDQAEKTRNLVMVTPSPAPARVAKTESTNVARRLISENDAVLDYLVTVPATLRLEEIRERQAGTLPRLVASLIDMFVCAMLFSPFAAVIELTNGDWYQIRTAAFALGFATFVSFFYLTFSTALTGRTLGMRLLSLRTVDRRTGLIPTGSQCVGRAVIFLASLLTLGVPVLFALIHPDGHTADDRLTGTVVVRA
jgi:uncharacterized RDD family membrane protein YckC